MICATERVGGGSEDGIMFQWLQYANALYVIQKL